MDENMGGLMKILREDKEYPGSRPKVKEGDSKKVDPSKPNVDHEAVGVESYEDEDLEKVKSQTLKNVDFAVRQVKDVEVQNPPVKVQVKESKITLYLCNECAKTFRSTEAKCIHCKKTDCVEKVTPEKKVYESVHELVGEIPGINPRNQKILDWAIRTGAVKNEWPEYEIMFDQLASAGVEADDTIQNTEDIQATYLIGVLLPQAKKAYAKKVFAIDGGHPGGGVEERPVESTAEGKIPSKDDDDAKIIKKLTEEDEFDVETEAEEEQEAEQDEKDKKWYEKHKGKDEIGTSQTQVVNAINKVMVELNLGYYYSSSRQDQDGSIVYEYTSISGAPSVEVHVKSPAPEAK